jgi:hypothetical protein
MPALAPAHLPSPAIRRTLSGLMNDNVDYASPAELYPAPAHRRGALTYHRFDSLAEAVRFASEELTAEQLAGAFIEADEERYDAAAIAGLYRSDGFPLARRAAE